MLLTLEEKINESLTSHYPVREDKNVDIGREGADEKWHCGNKTPRNRHSFAPEMVGQGTDDRAWKTAQSYLKIRESSRMLILLVYVVRKI